MSRRKRERICEACGQSFLTSGQHVRACSAACRERLRQKPSAPAGSRSRTSPASASKQNASAPAPSSISWTGRPLYSVLRTPPFLVVGRLILAETERLIFTSNSVLGEWESGVLHAAVFEKQLLLAAGSAGVFADFGAVFLRLEDAQAHSARKSAEERERLAQEMRREQERERQRERQNKKEHRSESRHRRSRQSAGPTNADPRQCFKALGLTWPCSLEDVKAAFRKLAHKHHPDKGGTTTAFIALRDAYLEAVEQCLAGGRG